jgi:hypothetical protein
MNSDARRIEDSGLAATGGGAAGAIADDADPMASAIGYEAADPLLLARLWGEPVEAPARGADAR